VASEGRIMNNQVYLYNLNNTIRFDVFEQSTFARKGFCPGQTKGPLLETLNFIVSFRLWVEQFDVVICYLHWPHIDSFDCEMDMV
jgi:hypothetical protein